MSDDRTVMEAVAHAAQACFQQNPVVILGSGASVPHKIRGMGELASFLLENVNASEGKEADAWLLIRTALASGDGLEDALLKTAAPPSLVQKIVALTWKAIATDDLLVMSRTIQGAETFHLTRLIQGMLGTTHTVMNIVTPNYDRIAEYATDMAGFFHATGFVPGLIRARERTDLVTIRRGAHPARTVRIWKVHGSLDWFVGPEGQVVSLPLSTELPEKFEPLIVTPGVSKFERTHDEPFRSAIQGADAALESGSSFLCVGYGFRDRHIQPKIVERCRQRNVPIVILARTLTDEAKSFLAKSAGQAYLALERDGDGTRIYSPDHPAGITVARPDGWSLENFNNLVL